MSAPQKSSDSKSEVTEAPSEGLSGISGKSDLSQADTSAKPFSLEDFPPPPHGYNDPPPPTIYDTACTSGGEITAPPSEEQRDPADGELAEEIHGGRSSISYADKPPVNRQLSALKAGSDGAQSP